MALIFTSLGMPPTPEINIGRRGLKIKVIGQGQLSRSVYVLHKYILHYCDVQS